MTTRGAPAGTAEVILSAGTVRTMDPSRPVAQAVAVADGRILGVGSREEMARLQGPRTELVDLSPDRAVLPGFVEAHAHPTIGMAFRNAGVVDVRASRCRTAAEVVATLEAAVADAPPGTPLTAVGWEDLLRPGLPEPTRDWLDALAPRHPVAVLHNSLHSAWGNSLALRAAGLDRDSPDPAGSWFVRGADGELTGRAEEVPATLVLAGAPLQIDPTQAAGLLATELRAFAAAGVTTVGELALDPASAGLLAGVVGATEAVRVRSYRMSGREVDAARRPAEGPIYRQVGVKLWADGSPWVGTFAACLPYEDTDVTRRLGIAGTSGCCNHAPDEARELCLEGLRTGEQVAVHAQGDRAIELVLDAIESALAQVSPEQRVDHRTRLEHCCLMTAAQYRRAARLGVTCSLFLAHVRYWGDVLESLVGDRAARWTAARSALDAGVVISLHNDVPVTPSEPLANVHAAVTRRTAVGGVVLGPEERISVEEALRAQTIDAAWQLRSEHEVGSLEVGKYADLVVLSADPCAVPADDLADLTVEGTWLAGSPVETTGAVR